MATPSGAISFEDIRTEFGQQQANNSLNGYYSGGSALGAPLANVPASGAISMSELRIIEKTSGSGNKVNAASGVPNGTHLIFITSGICYSDDSAQGALQVPGSRTGATTVVINHNIAGKGGGGGNGQGVTSDTSNHDASPSGSAGNGASGGPAVVLGSPTHLDNNSNIRAGAGGGGGGSAFGGEHGFASNGITCNSTNLKGIITNTNGNTAFLIGSAGGGASGGNSQINNSADGAAGNAGGGGHATNFSSANRNIYVTGTQCGSNGIYYTGRRVRMIASSNAGTTNSQAGGGSGISSACNGGAGGVDGNAGASTNAAGNLSHPTISDNGNSVSSTSATGSPDGGSGGGAGNAIQGWNSFSITVHGIVSTQGTFTGGIT